MTSLDLLVDGRDLTGAGRRGGLGSFTRNVVAALADRPELQVRVLTTDASSVPSGAEAVRMWRVFHDRRRSVLEHEVLLSLDLLRTRSDLVYSPVLSGVPRTRRPYVQTLHDVIPLVLPDPDLAHLRKWWSRWAARYRRADAVVAVSRYTAEEGIRVLGLDPARVHVAPNGVSPHFSPGRSGPLDDPPYLLIVSEYSTRKRFADAFAVIGALADAGYPHRLKVAGRVQDVYRSDVEHLVAAAAHPERIEMLGFVDDLVGLYRGATAFLWCSSYEGFGLPVLEAMASGVPVVSYANSSLVEVVADAGLLVADGDIPAMVGAVRTLLDEPTRWSEVRDAGIERARGFTWDACAATYAEVFAAVAGFGR